MITLSNICKIRGSAEQKGGFKIMTISLSKEEFNQMSISTIHFYHYLLWIKKELKVDNKDVILRLKKVINKLHNAYYKASSKCKSSDDFDYTKILDKDKPDDDVLQSLKDFTNYLLKKGKKNKCINIDDLPSLKDKLKKERSVK